MASLTPVFWADGSSGETLSINTVVHFGPVPTPTFFCCFLPEVLVVDNPAWPVVVQVAPGYQGQVGQQVLGAIWVLGCNNCHVETETLHPGGKVKDHLS